MPRRANIPNLDSELERAVAYRVLCLYLDESARKSAAVRAKEGRFMTVEQIADTITREFPCRLSRQQVYGMLERARELNLLRIAPPRKESLESAVSEVYKLDPNSIHVVDVRTQGEAINVKQRTWAGRQVAEAGAERVMELAKAIWNSRPESNRKPVCIGLGPGRATLDFSHSFSRLIQMETPSPKFEFIAITGGGDPEHPEYAPPSFFNLFPREHARFVGLFAETLVKAGEIDKLRSRPGVAEAMAKRDEIDIVVSSMGDPSDDHDLLTQFLKKAKVAAPRRCVGNMQYRPYSSKGPLLERKTQLRVLTLFELEDYCQMVMARNRHVILLTRACGACGRSRAAALRPLLASKETLKVWSEIVMDEATASELLQ